MKRLLFLIHPTLLVIMLIWPMALYAQGTAQLDINEYNRLRDIAKASDTLKIRLTQLQQELDMKKSENGKLKQDMETLKNRTQQDSQRIADFEVKQGKCESDRKQLERDTLSKANVIRSLRKETEGLTASKLKEQRERADNLEKELSDTNGQLAEEKQNSKTTTEELEKANGSIVENQKTLLKKDSIINKAQADLGIANQNIVQLNAQLREKEARISELEKNLKQLEEVKKQNAYFQKEKIGALGKMITQFADTSNMEGSGSLTSLRSAIEKYKAELRELKQVMSSPELNNFDNHLNKLSDCLTALDNAYKSLKNDYEKGGVQSAQDMLKSKMNDMPAKWRSEADRLLALLTNYCVRYSEAWKFVKNVNDSGFNENGQRKYINERKNRFEGYAYILSELEKKEQNVAYKCVIKEVTCQ